MRIRDIVHASGRRLRVALDPAGAGGMTISLSEPGLPGDAPVTLDLYGGELLSGFLVNARLADGTPMPDERCAGPFACTLRLVSRCNGAAVELHQSGPRFLRVDRAMWDRLYAELTLALTHARHLEGEPPAPALWSACRPRLLH